MFNRKHARRRRAPVRRSPAVIEAIETRTLMSAVTVASTMTSDAVVVRSAAAVTSTTPTGDTPAQIRAAYGFAGLTFAGGTVAADGAGQTIAIVDAYNDPNIAADLKVFDAQFDLAAPASLKVVNQSGGTSLPTTDAGWAGEISLDVEWAHAIAPAANILLVEASTDSTDDLMAAVNTARAAAGVSVVSLSWGGSESESWGQGGESQSQTTLDAELTTPAGHQGVTFVAAAGDSGQQSGAQWPASSPNVLSVGGTTLNLNADGTVASETGWAGTSSGYSTVEAEPAYQDAVQGSGFRSVADVAYDADPDTGFAVYDSVPADGVSGWQTVGGTSAGSPQWAALVAIADQGRVIAGTATLSGVNQTLPDLYALYSAYGTAGYTGTYTADFTDVTTGGVGTVGHRHGPPGSNGNAATVGYDLVTGLGTPKAEALVAALAGASADTGTGSTTGTGGGSTTAGGSGSTSDLTLSPVAVSLASTPAASVVGGASGVLRVRLTNTAATTFNGPMTIILYASADGTVTAGTDTAGTDTAGTDTAGTDTSVTTDALAAVKLKANASRVVTLKFKYPTTLATGDYQLIAQANATGTDTQGTTVATAPVTIAAPAVDFSVAFAGPASVAVKPGKKAVATVRVTNLGNVTAAGPVTVTLAATGDGLTTAVLAMFTRTLKLAAGKSVTLRLSFTALAGLAGGTYDLTATVAGNTSPADADTANDSATIATA